MNQHSSQLLMLREARNRSDQFFRSLAPGALYERAVAERHRFIFYLGHLEAFDWNLLAVGQLGTKPFREDWDRLFAFGIDPESTDLPTDSPSDWPAESDVRAYASCVRTRLDAEEDRIDPQFLQVAVEHRLMHLETLAYLLHNLPYQLKNGVDEPTGTSRPTPQNSLIAVSAGEVTLGQQPGRFGWDNEFAQHRRTVSAFEIQQHKVSNGEYLDFVREGAPAPHFWNKSSEGWRLRCMFSEIALPLDWPVYVTHQEAVAYSSWKGMRLPTEAEYHRAAFGSPSGIEREFPWGDSEPTASEGNFDFHRWNPCPVDWSPAGTSAFGISQLVGNGWEWTGTPFSPFEGFAAFPFYPGYSANFFDGKHFVLKGGSPRTAAQLLRRSFRNWFRGEYAYAFAGFRCVSGD